MRRKNPHIHIVYTYFDICEHSLVLNMEFVFFRSGRRANTRQRSIFEKQKLSQLRRKLKCIKHFSNYTITRASEFRCHFHVCYTYEHRIWSARERERERETKILCVIWFKNKVNDTHNPKRHCCIRNGIQRNLKKRKTRKYTIFPKMKRKIKKNNIVSIIKSTLELKCEPLFLIWSMSNVRNFPMLFWFFITWQQDTHTAQERSSERGEKAFIKEQTCDHYSIHVQYDALLEFNHFEKATT